MAVCDEDIVARQSCSRIYRHLGDGMRRVDTVIDKVLARSAITARQCLHLPYVRYSLEILNTGMYIVYGKAQRPELRQNVGVAARHGD